MVYLWSALVAVVSAGAVNVAVWAYRARRTHKGVRLVPGWMLTAEHLSDDVRIIVGKVARATMRDCVAEWDTMGPALRGEIDRMIRDRVAHMLGK